MQTPEEFAASLLDDWRLESVIKKLKERDEETRTEAANNLWRELEDSGRI